MDYYDDYDPPVDAHDWDVAPINCRDAEQGPIYVQLGPAAKGKGVFGEEAAIYTAGQQFPNIFPLPGQSFYLNGLPSPDLHLQRGQTYTFVVETGLGADASGRVIHPFYITSDERGGFQDKTELEQRVCVTHCSILHNLDIAKFNIKRVYYNPLWRMTYRKTFFLLLVTQKSIFSRICRQRRSLPVCGVIAMAKSRLPGELVDSANGSSTK